jgi:hypothetical protein
MARRPSSPLVLCGVVCTMLGGVPRAAAAQESILLRYNPQPGAWVRQIWWSEVTSTILDEGGGKGDLSVEAVGVQSITSRVLEIDDNRRVLEVTRDSLRARVRQFGGIWRTSADTSGPKPSAQLVVDDRLRVTDLRAPAGVSLSRRHRETLRAFAAGFELALPEQPITVGQTWSADVIYPIDEPLGVEDEPDIATWFSRWDDIVARSTFQLDSLVPRGTDTLAYLRVQGRFVPATIAPPAELSAGRARLDGTFGGTLIWSTSWNAFVSGAVRSLVGMTAFQGPPEQERPAFTLRLDIISRLQVRL